MAEPSKLIAGVEAVYGVEYVQRVYGEILPVDSERILTAEDGFVVTLAGRKLTCLDTPGHAKHHNSIVDEKTGGIFTGDLFGLSYRELDVDGRQFIFPTSSPSQFDPEVMHASIDRLLQLKPTAMYLTHYGQLNDVAQRGQDLHRRIDAIVKLAIAERSSGAARHECIKSAMTHYLLSEMRTHGCTLPEKSLLDIWEGDIDLNAQGLGIWLDS
jgi:glyoxylase-like metal-dependent hydrolase (beta-lactamase superfamily II)